MQMRYNAPLQNTEAILTTGCLAVTLVSAWLACFVVCSNLVASQVLNYSPPCLVLLRLTICHSNLVGCMFKCMLMSSCSFDQQ